MRVVGVDVVLGQLAGHVLVAAFLDLAGRGAGDGRGIVGAVTVTVMTCVAVPPLPSSTVTVMVVTFWPSARAWT